MIAGELGPGGAVCPQGADGTAGRLAGGGALHLGRNTGLQGEPTYTICVGSAEQTGQQGVIPEGVCF